MHRCCPSRAAGRSANQEPPVVSCAGDCLLVSREVDVRCIRVLCFCGLQCGWGASVVLEGREKIACVQRSWILRGLGVEVGQQVQQFSFAGCCLLILVGWMLDFCVLVVVICCSLFGFCRAGGQRENCVCEAVLAVAGCACQSQARDTAP